MTDSSISSSLARVRADVADAATRCGRRPQDVLLLAVSKTKPVEAVVAAYDAGQRDFGENYAQELGRKAEALAHLPGLRWHHIGHLQSNKLRQLAPLVHALHGVDRESLLDELAKRLAATERQVELLLEVNVAGELSKSGCTPEALPSLLRAARARPGLLVRGLMTMPPLCDDPESSRPYFRRLRELRDELGGAAALPELSMGMSHDFRVAIEEGATIVRVGTAIFGQR